MKKNLISALILLLLIVGCGENNNSADENDDYFAKNKRLRQEKDQMFKTSPSSPIPAAQLSEFTGLKYYPLNLKYRFWLKLNHYDSPEVVQMLTSTGESRKALKYGRFDFKIDSVNCSLQVYKLESRNPSSADHLFMPFTDQTNGIETYGGGRYIDLDQKSSGIYLVDFNEAYYPLCAYGSSNYSCPIPPEENHLDAAIKAGETGYLKNKN